MPTGTPTKMKKCAICGELFLPAKPSSRICSKSHYANCPICKKPIEWNTTRAVEPCSAECKKQMRKLRSLEKYGVEHPMQCKAVQEHHKEAMRKKYGVDSPLQSKEIKDKVIATNRAKFGTDWALSNDEVKEKAMATMTERYGASTTLQSDELRAKVQSTMIERYGELNPSKVEEIRHKVEQTNLERYGTANPMQNSEIAQRSVEHRTTPLDEIWNKSKQTWLTTLGVDNPSKSPAVIDKITSTFLRRYGVVRAINVPEFREKMRQTMIARYGVPDYSMTDEFRQSQKFRISQTNKQFSALLLDQGIENSFEFQIGLKSYDIKIANSNTLIELDPTYTHNVIGNHWNTAGLPANYHRDKTQLAESEGYRCIHVFDWDNWTPIVNMLLPKKRVYARECTIYRLNKNVGDEFLQNYHIQGTCRGQLLYLGLVYEGELLQVMTFGKSRFDKNYDVELLRLCTKPGVVVVGGASKLFSYATNEYGLSKIISYCDRAKFNGDVYTRIGMQLKRITPPQEIWSKGSNRITANLLRARGYDQLFGTNYGKGTSNEALMLQDGWLPIFDCGQKVFVYD